MQIVAVTDPLELGFARQAMIGIRVNGPASTDRRHARDARGGRLRRHHRRPLRHARRGRSARATSSCSSCCPTGSAPSTGVERTETFMYLKLAQADLLMGRALADVPRRLSLGAQTARYADAAAAAARRPRRRRRDRRRRASPGCGRRTTCRGRPDAAGRVLEAESRRLRRVRPQRRLVLGALPRVPGHAGRAARVRREARRCPARGDARTVDEVGRVAAPRASTSRLRQGRHARAGPHRGPAAPGPGRGGRARAWGSATTTSRCSTRTRRPRVVGRPACCGAMYTPHCAAVHPARLVRGLGRGGGAPRRHDPRADPVRRDRPGPRRHRPAATVRAEHVVRATEGYTPTLPGSGARSCPVYSLMIATEPLPAAMWEQIGCAGRETFSDGRHLIIYGQRTADDRIAFGGRGAPYHFGSRIQPALRPRAAGLRGAARDAGRPVPGASPTRAITHAWGGPLGIPRDWCASVGLDRATGLGWAGGYVGDGVAHDEPRRPHPARPGPRARHRPDPAAWVGHRSPPLGAGAAALARHQRRPAGDDASPTPRRQAMAPHRRPEPWSPSAAWSPLIGGACRPPGGRHSVVEQRAGQAPPPGGRPLGGGAAGASDGVRDHPAGGWSRHWGGQQRAERAIRARPGGTVSPPLGGRAASGTSAATGGRHSVVEQRAERAIVETTRRDGRPATRWSSSERGKRRRHRSSATRWSSSERSERSARPRRDEVGHWWSSSEQSER